VVLSIHQGKQVVGSGRVELVEAKAEKHVFHMLNPNSPNTTTVNPGRGKS